MAFLKLSETLLDLDKIKLVYPGFPRNRKQHSCTVFFVDSDVPYAFYGDDAKRIVEAVDASRVKPDDTSALVR